MIDQKDVKILGVLKNNSKLSAKDISKITGIPTTTVFHRIKKLEKSKVIKKYIAVVDEERLGKDVKAYVMITVDYNSLKKAKMSQHELAVKLRRHELVDETAILTGGNDIIIKISATTLAQLNEFITSYLRNVDGIERTQTAVILENF